ncbi:endolytic transglycosylase MltG [Lichenicola sp.]|uniref:endolytic transglycosylase MltG n=1 Tax=Lichenicola sp. TaxID=2804529 RepID=UPI003B009B06
MRLFVRLLSILVVLLVLAGAGGAVVLRMLWHRPGPLPQTADLVVPRSRLPVLASVLQRDQLLRPGDSDRLVFMILARLTASGGALHAGELRFPAHASIGAILQILRHAKPVQHELTIPEGLTSAQIAGLVERAPALVGDLAVPPEGSILPETYAYELGTSRTALLARMHAALRAALAQTWAGRDPSLPLSDPRQLLILASIVERETGVGSERAQVAEVFVNRIRQGMKLQSDPTVAYGAGGGLGSLPRPLTRADLVQPSPYNTYVIPGLPVGPISAPGIASLQAVAHPATGDLLYFVATGSGGHAFAATLPEHLRNVAQLRAIEAARPSQAATLDPLRPPPQVPMEARGR